MPGLDVLVRVFDHHHRRVDHRADGDSDTAERHDVGIDTLVVHDDESDQHAEGQRDDGDETASAYDYLCHARDINIDQFLPRRLRHG